MTRKLLVIIALLGFLAVAILWLGRLSFDWGLFRRSLVDLHWGWIGASIVVTLMSYVLRGIRWQVLLDDLKHVRLGPLVGATFVGFSTIYLLGRAGELARPLWIARREGVPFPGAMASIVVERFLDSLMLVVVFAIVVATVDLPQTGSQTLAIMEQMKGAALVSAAGLIAAMVVMLLFHGNIDRITSWIPFPRIASLTHQFAQGFSVLRRHQTALRALAHSAGVWFVIALEFWLLLVGLRLDLSFGQASMVMVAVALGSLAQIPGIGGGFQAAFVFCLVTFFSVPAEKAVAGALLAWVFAYAPTVGVTAMYLAFQGLSWSDVRMAPGPARTMETL